jgi:exonuclease III
MEFFEKERPDVICLQETKATKEQVEDFFEKSDTPLFDSQSEHVKNGKLFPDYKYHF